MVIATKLSPFIKPPKFYRSFFYIFNLYHASPTPKQKKTTPYPVQPQNASNAQLLTNNPAHDPATQPRHQRKTDARDIGQPFRVVKRQEIAHGQNK